jgi:hypothetical protein
MLKLYADYVFQERMKEVLEIAARGEVITCELAVNKALEEVEKSLMVKYCDNTSKILGTKKYIWLDDIQEVINNLKTKQDGKTEL